MKHIIPVICAFCIVLCLCVVHPQAGNTFYYKPTIYSDQSSFHVYELNNKPNTSRDFTYYADFEPALYYSYDMTSSSKVFFDTNVFDQNGVTAVKFSYQTLQLSDSNTGIVFAPGATYSVSSSEEVFQYSAGSATYHFCTNSVVIVAGTDGNGNTFIPEFYITNTSTPFGGEGLFAVSSVEVTYTTEAANNLYLDSLTSSTIAIEGALTDVTPEMQDKLDRFDSIVNGDDDKAGEAEDELSSVDPDLKDDVSSMADSIVSATDELLTTVDQSGYTEWLNDLFGHWFFVAMFSVFGALAFFGRAVFG